jgi:hypothetical protein
VWSQPPTSSARHLERQRRQAAARDERGDLVEAREGHRRVLAVITFLGAN